MSTKAKVWRGAWKVDSGSDQTRLGAIRQARQCVADRRHGDRPWERIDV